jgi:tRNA dimethylallyltransferase
MQGLGYKQMLSYLAGDISREEAINLIKRDTRHFAKRQLTWLRRESKRCEDLHNACFRNGQERSQGELIWLDKQDYADDEAILAEMMRRLGERGIIGANNKNYG